MEICTSLLTLDYTVSSNTRESREQQFPPYFVSTAGPGRGPQSRPLAPLSSPQSISPARDQTICPVTDLWVHRDKARFKEGCSGRQGGDGGRERERNKVKLAKRKRSERARGAAGGASRRGGGGQASCCLGRGGKRCCSKGGGGRGKLMRGSKG